jgi:hypothetical protein
MQCFSYVSVDHFITTCTDTVYSSTLVYKISAVILTTAAAGLQSSAQRAGINSFDRRTPGTLLKVKSSTHCIHN